MGTSLSPPCFLQTCLFMEILSAHCQDTLPSALTPLPNKGNMDNSFSKINESFLTSRGLLSAFFKP